MNLPAVLNLIACAAIFWTCATFLLVRGKAGTMRALGTQIGLVLSMVGAMTSGLAPLRFGIGPDWWSLVLRAGIAAVALTQYDKAFGIRAQWAHALAAVLDAPAQLRAWWSAAWSHAQDQARSKAQK